MKEKAKGRWIYQRVVASAIIPTVPLRIRRACIGLDQADASRIVDASTMGKKKHTPTKIIYLANVTDLAKLPCSFFMTGPCTNGQYCPMTHGQDFKKQRDKEGV